MMVGVPLPDEPPESDPPPPQAAMPTARKDARIILTVFISAPSLFFWKRIFSCGGGEAIAVRWWICLYNDKMAK
jgi:hypothetical protein